MFDWRKYINLNPDLENNWNGCVRATLHYLIYGYREKRPISDNHIDIESYFLKKNPLFINGIKRSKGVLHIGECDKKESDLYKYYEKDVISLNINTIKRSITNKKQILISGFITVNFDKVLDFKKIKFKDEDVLNIYKKYNINYKNLDTLILDKENFELLLLKNINNFLKGFKWVWLRGYVFGMCNDESFFLNIREILNRNGFFEIKNGTYNQSTLFYKESEFNDDIILSKNVEGFIKDNKIKNIVETGTYRGDTTKFFAKKVEKVYTLEINPVYKNISQNRFDMPRNINFHLGNSWEILDKEVITKLKGESLFFLDAHWGVPCPTPLELDMIAKHGIKPHIIIHDFKVPNNSWLGWDIYPDFEYKFENIERILDKIYGIKRYYYEYNTKAVGARRGVIFISPKK